MKLVDSNRLDTALAATANAIRDKDPNAAASIPWDLDTGFASAVSNIPTGGGGPITGDDVRFYDYDGTLFAGYSAADFAVLTEMPANPSHEGLTAQGWNWSLANAKAYVAKYGKLNIGQMYITDDGKTRIYIHLEKGRTSPMLGVCPNGTVDVDWGDGTAHDTLTGTSTTTVKWTPTHNYAAPGDYVIKLTVTGNTWFSGVSSSVQGPYLLRGSSGGDNINYIYRNAVKKIEIGNGVTRISTYAFLYCYALTNVIIPDGVTFISDYAFNNCSSLTNVIIPNSITDIGSDAFSDGGALANVIIPDSITRIKSYAFSSCGPLTSITIPEGVTSIGSNVFARCYSLANVIIPDGVTDIGGGAFYYCKALAHVKIPDGVTNIGDTAFQYLYSLVNITIPDDVTRIGSGAFNGCHGVAEYHLLPTTPPTLANVSAFNDIPSDCVIYVPQGSLEAYQTATNWSTYASQMQEEP